MAINKKLIHFKTKLNFNNEVANNNILDTSICFIKDSQQIYTHGQYYSCKDWANDIDNLQTQINTLISGDASTAIDNFNEIIAFLENVTDSESLDAIIASIESQIADKQDKINDLSTIRDNASKGATAVQPSQLSNVATSGSYNDLTNKPTIPTSSIVSDWGFTKNTGTYSKPSDGIPKSDMDTNVKSSLEKADSALQVESDPVFTASAAYSIKSSDISNWNSKTSSIKFSNVSAASWVADTTYSDFGYKCDMTCSGVTASDYAEVVFDVTQASSGNYAPVCATDNNIVSIWSSVNDAITVPVIIITK